MRQSLKTQFFYCQIKEGLMVKKLFRILKEGMWQPCKKTAFLWKQ